MNTNSNMILKSMRFAIHNFNQIDFHYDGIYILRDFNSINIKFDGVIKLSHLNINYS